MARYNPLRELTITRTREFFREPEALFWVYVFPILLMVGLGIAFRGGGPDELSVDVTPSSDSERLASILQSKGSFKVRIVDLAEARARYAAGKVDLIVVPRDGDLQYIYDASRLGAEGIRLRVDNVLQQAAGREDPVSSEIKLIEEPGSRYIDWLIPGLLGMNIMGSGLWGVGFVTVDLRMRKLLKCFAASPMRRSDFLISLIGSRLLFLISEMALILGAGYLIFGLPVNGSLLAVLAVTILGSVCFGGLGLLLACRTDRIETISGLLNGIMLPMYILSGVFFSSERFPDAMQPLVQVLPLTQLNKALRATILEGLPFYTQWLPALALAAFGVASFALALRFFKWQ